MPPKKATSIENPIASQEIESKEILLPPECQGKWLKLNLDDYNQFLAGDDSDLQNIFENISLIDAGPENLRAKILTDYLLFTLM